MTISSPALHRSNWATTIIALLLLTGLTGCAGFSSVTEGNADYWAVRGKSKISGSQFQPQLITITPDLLIQQARQRRRSSSSDNLDRLQASAADYEYRIGPWDQLRIGVWNHPEFSFSAGPFDQQAKGGEETYTVHGDGDIYFPYAGRVQVAGKTIEEVRTSLSRSLATYIENPQVGVRITGFHSQEVYVTGEVGKPAGIPLTTRPMNVLDALHLAGEPTAKADRTSLLLTRTGTTYRIDLLHTSPQLLSHIYLQDGDLLHLPSNLRQQAYVVGEVNEQTAADFVEGELTLSEALSQAGGLDMQTANTRGVFIIRGFPLDSGQPSAPREGSDRVRSALNREMGLSKDQARQAAAAPDGELPMRPKVYHLDASQASSLVLAHQFYLQPQDIVYVSSTELTRWSRMISKLLPTVNSLRTLDNLGN